MVDKIKKVSNPLTIIAIFAGLAEIAATVALGLIDPEIQRIFIWFVMLFPALLVISFFLVLWFKPEHLYAPSDYIDENNFMKNVAKYQAVKYVNAAMDKLSDASIQPEVKNELLSDLNNAKEAVDNMDNRVNRFSQKQVVDYVLKRKPVLKILELLYIRSELSVKEIAETLGISSATATGHISRMEDLMLVAITREESILKVTITSRGKYILDSISNVEINDLTS